jgi:hypothetical protein
MSVLGQQIPFKNALTQASLSTNFRRLAAKFTNGIRFGKKRRKSLCLKRVNRSRSMNGAALSGFTVRGALDVGYKRSG